MKRYKIKDKYNAPYSYKFYLERGRKERMCVTLEQNSTTTELESGDHITILQDKFLSIEDYVYLYPGGMQMQTVPAWADKYSCRIYIKNLPGLFDCGKLDRVLFKIALLRECGRRGIAPSFRAWHNLQNIMMHRAKSNPRW